MDLLLAARRVGPTGRALGVDMTDAMVERAGASARAAGLAQVEVRKGDATSLPVEDASVDVVISNGVINLVPEKERAFDEIVRVLKPGGRLCSSVWVKPDANPWTAIAMQAIATESVVAPPDPDGPNMFRCAAPGYVSSLYEGAGLRDVAEWDVDVELVTRSPEQYWEMISEHV